MYAIVRNLKVSTTVFIKAVWPWLARNQTSRWINPKADVCLSLRRVFQAGPAWVFSLDDQASSLSDIMGRQ